MKSQVPVIVRTQLFATKQQISEVAVSVSFRKSKTVLKGDDSNRDGRGEGKNVLLVQTECCALLREIETKSGSA